MVVVGKETRADPTGHSVGLRGGVRSTFLRSSIIRLTLLGQCERLPRTGTARWKRTSGVSGLAREAYVLCVSHFPCRLYIDSNHRDSQI
jgi:hypothetical protein